MCIRDRPVARNRLREQSDPRGQSPPEWRRSPIPRREHHMPSLLQSLSRTVPSISLVSVTSDTEHSGHSISSQVVPSPRRPEHEFGQPGWIESKGFPVPLSWVPNLQQEDAQIPEGDELHLSIP